MSYRPSLTLVCTQLTLVYSPISSPHHSKHSGMNRTARLSTQRDIFVAREFARFRLRRVPMLSLTRQQVDASLGRSRRDREAATNLRIQSAVPTDFFSYQAWVPLRA